MSKASVTRAGAPARLESGDRLPPLSLAGKGEAPSLDLRSGRGPRVVVTLHERPCRDCEGYLDSLAGALDEAREWGGEILALAPGSRSGKWSGTPPEIPVFDDPERVLASGRAAAFVADRWGEVYFAAEAGQGHGLPEVGELVSWLRFIAIQCPECEGPEGPWRTL